MLPHLLCLTTAVYHVQKPMQEETQEEEREARSGERSLLLATSCRAATSQDWQWQNF
jgi:hypothetical protein